MDVTRAGVAQEQPPGFHPPALDADSARFWAATREHQLLLQSCDTCGTYRWPPRPICWACGSTALAEVPASGRATAYSWTVVHHATAAVDPGRMPYTVVLAALEEDPRILVPGQLDGERGELRPGVPLGAAFHEAVEGITVLHWAVAPRSDGLSNGQTLRADRLDPRAGP